MSNALVDEALLARHADILGGLSQLERISDMSTAIQKLKDGPYAQENYRFHPQYEIGDEIVVCSEFYYYAKVKSIRGDFECPDLKKLIPAYEVVYRGWSAPEPDREFVAEYDILALTGPNYKPVELFMAYNWNKLHHWTKLNASRKKGVFALDAGAYKALREEVNAQFSSAFPDVDVGDFRRWFEQSSPDGNPAAFVESL